MQINLKRFFKSFIFKKQIFIGYMLEVSSILMFLMVLPMMQRMSGYL
jgi:hypothetical protein